MTVPGRADARHNHARVLEAAREAFAEEGPSATLDTVARRAGVGAGTVYRRFPSKEALLAAVVNDRLDRLVDELAAPASGDPGAAFFAAFERAVSQVALNKALCESMSSATGISPGVRDRFLAALAPLLAGAQRSGAVRPDVTAADVTSLIAGCAAMEHAAATPGRSTAIVLDGLRTAVTKPNEIRCAECGTPIAPTATGRPARYCGNACRQRAHRRRHTPA
ncbi:TetR/AcrR family transcriptional regulator [Nonomuraea rubra]|uniref:AcrR family transcriptional regulator n=1 Tax=Nonomuraea rubra TaxID=46180 RepID=A0A7X0P5K9_9ACTN|nr:TetR/AcrR family transcriptional regulator [Nonomuraea rubra]MBB6555708.1 AcrR family transcriptional regulator [Nonomuraea rubra]